MRDRGGDPLARCPRKVRRRYARGKRCPVRRDLCAERSRHVPAAGLLMKARTLFAVARADWSPVTGRAFAQVGPRHVIGCDPKRILPATRRTPPSLPGAGTHTSDLSPRSNISRSRVTPTMQSVSCPKLTKEGCDLCCPQLEAVGRMSKSTRGASRRVFSIGAVDTTAVGYGRIPDLGAYASRRPSGS